MLLFLKKYYRSILWAIFILIICVLPSEDIEKVRFIEIPYMDKFVHLGLYVILTTFLLSDSKIIDISGARKTVTLLVIFLLTLSYGILIELIQLFFTSSRSADVWDAVADAIGIALALANYKWINRITGGII